MLDLLNRLHFNVILWQRPTLVQYDYPLYIEAEQKHFLVRGPDGHVFICPFKYGGPSGLVDFTNPAAVRWWQGKVAKLTEMGARSYKLDSASSGFIPAYPETQKAQFHNGLSGRELENYYGPLYIKTVWDAHRKALNGKRAVLHIYHSAYFAASRFPYLSLGDRTYHSTRGVRIRIALNFGLSGIPFWKGGGIGSFGLPDVDSELNIRLSPYTYTYWFEAHETGLPVTRAMMLEYPDDQKSHDIDSQFLFGREILAAPVQSEDEEWVRVYVPEGEWVNYWTKEKYLGPEWKYIKAEPGGVVLLMRGGSIIPMGPMMEYIGQKPVNPLTLEIYPHGESSFVLYEDDGETYAYENGSYCTTEFTCRELDGDLQIRVNAARGEYDRMLETRDYILKIVAVTRPETVYIDDVKLEPIQSKDALEKRNRGWVYHMTNGFNRMLTIKIPDIKSDRSMKVTVKRAVPVRYYY
jgi:alpha-glucosidase